MEDDDLVRLAKEARACNLDAAYARDRIHACLCTMRRVMSMVDADERGERGEVRRLALRAAYGLLSLAEELGRDSEKGGAA